MECLRGSDLHWEVEKKTMCDNDSTCLISNFSFFLFAIVCWSVERLNDGEVAHGLTKPRNAHGNVKHNTKNPLKGNETNLSVWKL